MTISSVEDTPISERPRLLRLAYRMLGSVSEAEDVVQDAFLRLTAQSPQPRSPAAWLTTVTSRLAIDRLRRIKARRETYPGPWLPEPLQAEEDERAGDLSMGFLLLLERLSPEERAAFTLREAFGTPYAEIAPVLDKSEPAVRQLVSRAREKVRRDRPEAGATSARHSRLLDAFVAAVASGDIEAVKRLLSADVRFVTDGGGRKSAALRVIHGRDEAASLMHFLSGRGGVQTLRALQLNGATGLFVVDLKGDPFTIQIETDGQTLSEVYVMRNPEKLKHLVSV